MSQHDFEIANQGFPPFRSDLNNALQALASNSAGATEPTTTFAYQMWYDDTNDLLKMRNSDDDAWITLAAFDQTNDEWEIRSAVIQAVDSAGVVIKTDDGTTRIEVQDDGDVSIDSGTLFVDASANSVGIGTTSPDFQLHVAKNGSTYIQTERTTSGSEAKLLLGSETSDNTIISRSSGTNAKSLTFIMGNSEAARIDSNGNLLVGKTNTGATNAGHDINSVGTAYHTRDGGNTLVLNRLTSDGDIAQFRKDGTVVGSIGSRSGVVSFIVLDPRSGGHGLTANTEAILPSDENGDPKGNDTDIGSDSHRFKDLYLSGGVYLGGTGSANKLDDYEEGTWTPTFRDNSGNAYTGSYAQQTGKYTKIGNLVYVDCIVQSSSSLTSNGLSGSQDIEIHGLPFPNNTVQVAFETDSTRVDMDSGYTFTNGFVQDNGNTYVRFRQNGDNVNSNNVTVTQFSAISTFTQFAVIYLTDS